MILPHSLQHWLAPLASAAALVWSLRVRLSRSRRAPMVRAEDLSDWLLADIGWRDGRDTGARRMGRQAALPARALR